MNTNGFDNLDRKRYDARADRLFIPMFFIVDFLFYLYFCGGIGEEKTPDVLITLVIGLAFTLIGTFDFLQSEGASKNGIYFWGILWFAGAGLISATAMSPLNQALCALLIIVAKFLVYAGGVQILFSGYNHQIKAWMITVIFIVSGFTELRVLLFVPECLLLYLCICNRKSLPSWVSPRVYKVAMGILILNIAVVLTGMVYGLLSDTGEDPFFWGLVWAIVALFLIEILFFSVLYRGILKKRDEQFIGDNQFTLIFTVAGIIATGLLYRYGLTLNECVFSVFLFTFAILLYKFVEAVFKTDKWQNRKNLADLQFESGIKRDRDSADFLHDEVLQDLYAVKLLTQNFGETGENAKEVNEILSNLQFRIRGELEASGMNKEKSFSFKDNIRIMLAGLQKRFCEKKWKSSLTVRRISLSMSHLTDGCITLSENWLSMPLNTAEIDVRYLFSGQRQKFFWKYRVTENRFRQKKKKFYQRDSDLLR